MFAAIQTIVGQVNSEFQEDVTRMIRLGAVSRLDGDNAWEISRTGQRMGKNQRFQSDIDCRRRVVEQFAS